MSDCPLEKCIRCEKMRPRYQTVSTCEKCVLLDKCKCGTWKNKTNIACDACELRYKQRKIKEYKQKFTCPMCSKPKKEMYTHCYDCAVKINSCIICRRPKHSTRYQHCYNCYNKFKTYFNCEDCDESDYDIKSPEVPLATHCKKCIKMNSLFPSKIIDKTKWIKISYTKPVYYCSGYKDKTLYKHEDLYFEMYIDIENIDTQKRVLSLFKQNNTMHHKLTIVPRGVESKIKPQNWKKFV